MDLKSWDTTYDFHKNMSLVFTNQKVYKDGRITLLTSHQVGEAQAASGVYGGTFDTISTCSNQEDANAVMKTTNCPICRLPKGYAKSHHIAQCPFILVMGLSIKYTEQEDQRCFDYEKKKKKKKQRASKFKTQDEADTVLDANHGLVKKRGGTGYYTAVKTKAFKERQAKKRAREETEATGTIVGASNTDTVTNKEKDDAIQKNLDEQSKMIGGAGRHVTGGLSYFAQSKEDCFEFSDVSTSVDAASAVHSVNTSNSQGYFQTVVNSMLRPLNCVSADGTVCKCISIARYSCHNIRINVGIARPSTAKFDFDHIVPDSGETSHMRRNRYNFENDYDTCNDVFVLMGDNLEILILGFGTAQMKIDGHVVCLVNKLHVPDLDFDLFSCIRHGANSKGNTFLLGEGKIHLTFLAFIVTDDIPANGDLKVQIQPLTKEDWGIPNFICDGVPLQDK